MPERAEPAARRGILELTVFVGGALVMIYEINGSRIVAPFIGSSTYVWTSLIGVILGALSLGYWLGGRAADRRPHLKFLASVVFLAGGAVAATILLKDFILALIAAAPFILEIKAVLAALLLFAPASVLLGFVTPYAVKLKMLSLDDSGKTVGRLYALSTVGSIAGTFLAGFVLIPFFGSARTLYLIAAALFGLALLLAPFALTRTNLTALVVYAFGLASTELLAVYQFRAQGLRDFDTEYSRARIFELRDERTGRPVRALTFDPYSIQSKMYLDGDELASDYLRYYHLVRHFRPDFERALMIGGAGYSFPKDYLKTYPGRPLDTVEIDPQLTAAARLYFGLPDDADHRIVHADGRVFLNAAPAASYDAVFLDAFGSLLNVPFHLTTVEAVREIDRVLRPGGVVIFNLGGALEGPQSRFLKAELNTYKAVFPQVLLFKVAPQRPAGEVQNLVIAALKTDAPPPLESPDAALAELLANRLTALPEGSEPILTDDRAPVEFFNSFGR